MSRGFTGWCLAGGLVLMGCGQTTVEPKSPPKVTASTATAATSLSVEDFVIGEPLRFENLTIFPVSSRVLKADDRFITLDEGLKAGTVEIRELGGAFEPRQPNAAANQAAIPASDDGIEAPVSAITPHQQDEPFEEPLRQRDTVVSPRNDGQAATPFEDVLANDLPNGQASNDVNSLIVVNHSDKPLYLMPGEVIIGGSQDRTIGNELVIAPRSQPTRVPVYCVEHGRWGMKGAVETLAQIQSAAGSATLDDSVAVSPSADLATLAQEADRGKFVASVGQLGKSARVAVQSDKSQSAVWKEVAKTNSQSGVQSDSGAFTANYVASLTITRLEPYLEHLQGPVTDLEQPVGVLVAINGKIESIDVFESTPLFKKLWPKLLKSYALDAANARDDSAEDTAPECTLTAARTFFTEALQAKVESSEQEHGVALTKRDSQHVISFTSHVDQVAAPSAMGGFGGGGVHFSGYAK